MRRVHITLAILSGLLCAATLGIGLRSYWYRSGWYNGRRLLVQVEAGTFSATVFTPQPMLGGDPFFYHHYRIDGQKFWDPDEFDGGANGIWLLGFRASDWSYNGLNCIYVDIPLYFPAIVFGLGCFVCRRAALRVVPSGHCLSCGYDLRATPGKCPECGAESAAGSTRPAIGAIGREPPTNHEPV